MTIGNLEQKISVLSLSVVSKAIHYNKNRADEIFPSARSYMIKSFSSFKAFSFGTPLKSKSVVKSLSKPNWRCR